VIHGGHYTDNRALLDGMQFNGEGNGRGFYFNPAAASEISVQLGGQTAEFENGGAQANLVPRDGGNQFPGMFSVHYAGHGRARARSHASSAPLIGSTKAVCGAAAPANDPGSGWCLCLAFLDIRL